MTSTALETLPTTWDDARDVPFFRITARLFSPQFCFRAGVRLGSNDTDVSDAAELVRVPARHTHDR